MDTSSLTLKTQDCVVLPKDIYLCIFTHSVVKTKPLENISLATVVIMNDPMYSMV